MEAVRALREAWMQMPKQPGHISTMLCLVDEAGSLRAVDPEPFRIGFLMTYHRDRLESDIKRLKKELPPRGKSGEYHAREDHPHTRAMIRRLLLLNDEPRMYILEYAKKDFSADFFVNGKLRLFQDIDPLVGSFALTASQIIAAASANRVLIVDVIVEAAKSDIESEHRSRDQALRQVLQVALEKQARIKRPPPETRTVVRVSTTRKWAYSPLSFVDYWLWAYCRCSDHGDRDVFPKELRRRTSVKTMQENDFKRVTQSQ